MWSSETTRACSTAVPSKSPPANVRSGKPRHGSGSGSPASSGYSWRSERAAAFQNTIRSSLSSAITPSCRPSRSCRSRSRCASRSRNELRRWMRIPSIVSASEPSSSRKPELQRRVERAALDLRRGPRDPAQARRDQARDEQADERADQDREERGAQDLVVHDPELRLELGPADERDHRAAAVRAPAARRRTPRRRSRPAPAGRARSVARRTLRAPRARSRTRRRARRRS